MAESAWFYWSLMLVFILAAWGLSFASPFHSSRHRQEDGRARIASLDGLRGILAVSVFFLHAAEYYHYEQTGLWLRPRSNFYCQLEMVPVSMFFFITGYVFWLKLKRTPRLPVRAFLWARLGRLFPVYLCACVLCFGLIAVASGFHRYVPSGRLVLQGGAWLTFFGSGHDINHVFNSRLWLGPAWTLKFEWLFYLCVPLLGWFSQRVRRLPALFLGAGLASFFLARTHLGGPAHFVLDMLQFYGSFLAYVFSVGILMAALDIPSRLKDWARSYPATCLSLTLIAAVLFLMEPAYGPRESAMLAIPFACIALGNNWFGLLTSRPVRLLGRVSYSFYLLHMVILAIGIFVLKRYASIASMQPLRYWAFAGCLGVLAIALSAFSYQYLEDPFLHVGRQRLSRQEPPEDSLHSKRRSKSRPPPSLRTHLSNVLTGDQPPQSTDSKDIAWL